MHVWRNVLRRGLQLACRWQEQRLLATSSHIIKSPFPDVDIPNITLSEYAWNKVDRWPDKVAFECAVTGRCYKYGEAHKLCRRFAASLRRAGLQPNNTLAIIMPNSAEWPIVLLGAVEAGLMVMTANPSYTPEEIAKQLRDCEVHAIVTVSIIHPIVHQAIVLSGQKEKPLVIIAPGIEADSPIPSGTVNLQEMLADNIDTSNVRCPSNIQDTVILPYSSGTTGLPKGVMLSHWNLVANCVALSEEPQITLAETTTSSHQDVVPVVLPYFHIYGMVVVMLTNISRGVKLVTLPRFEPNSFIKMLDNHKASILCVAPPLVLFMASHEGVQSKHLESVRYVLSGAAPLGKPDIERFRKKAPPSSNVIQAYGMTETSPGALHMIKTMAKYDSVGVPIPNTDIKVRHVDSGDSLPPGEVGEICIRGPQVMKGYFNRPEATSEAIDSEGWLFSGDLGYYDKDGFFYIVDRLKELIKVKGFQVAPAELEEILRSHPDINDAAVIGIPDDRAGEVPRAYVVPKGSKISEDDIKTFLAEKVSDYKQLKGGVVFMDSIPKNASGKILRRKLKELL